MAFNTKKQWLQQQLAATKELLEISKDSELMRISLENRIKSLEQEISELESEPEITDATISMWFSGEATFGSLGLRGGFMKDTLNSVEGMVFSSVRDKIRKIEIERHHRVRKPKGHFYVTALTNGSFGYEMTYKEDGEMFENEVVIESISDVMQIIERTADSGINIDEMVDEQPLRLMSHLKDFYTTLKKSHSFLKMQSGNLGFELDNRRTLIGYDNLCAQNVSEEETVIFGVFRGALMDSGKFEYRDNEDKSKTGRISEDLEDDAIEELVRQYYNKRCAMKVVRHLSNYSNGKKREVIELIGIEDMPSEPAQTPEAPSSN